MSNTPPGWLGLEIENEDEDGMVRWSITSADGLIVLSDVAPTVEKAKEHMADLVEATL